MFKSDSTVDVSLHGATLNSKAIVPAVLVPMLVIGLSVFLFGVHYRSNDDAIISAISTAAFGDSVHLVFSNIILGHLIKALNTFYVANWFVILQLVFIAIAFATLCHIFVMKLGVRSGIAWTAVVCAAFGARVFCFIQFTVSGFVIAACGFLMISEHLGKKNFGTAIGILLVWVGSLFRFSCFLAAGALCASLLLYRFFALESKPKRWTAVLTMTALFILVLGSYMIDKAAYSSPEWQSYLEYNAARAQFSDYAALTLGSNNPFLRHGITTYDYAMLKNWNFYDPVFFKVDLLKNLAVDALAFKRISLIDSIGNVLRTLTLPDELHNVMLLIGFIICAVILLQKKARIVVISTVTSLVALVVILAYVYNGRITPWVEVGLLFAFSAYILYLLSDTDQQFVHSISLPVLLCVALSVLNLFVYSNVYNEELVLEQEKIERFSYFEEMSADDENLFLIDTLTCDSMFNMDVWNPAGNDFYDNIVMMGGWLSHHPDQVETLERFGIVRPIVDSVNHPNVFLDHNNAYDVLAYAKRQLDCEVELLVTHHNAYCPYQLVTVDNQDTPE